MIKTFKDIEKFHHPKNLLCPFLMEAYPSPLASGISIFCPYKFAFLRMSFKWAPHAMAFKAVFFHLA